MSSNLKGPQVPTLSKLQEPDEALIFRLVINVQQFYLKLSRLPYASMPLISVINSFHTSRSCLDIGTRILFEHCDPLLSWLASVNPKALNLIAEFFTDVSTLI